MNVFVLDYDIKKAAQYHCDKHVLKQVLECGQILSSALHNNDIIPNVELYKPTHLNHPIVRWATTGYGNFVWVLNLGLNLLNEYNYRYEKIHKTSILLDNIWKNLPFIKKAWPNLIGRAPFVQCVPAEYIQKNGDTVEAYREYYRGAKTHILQYTKRERPEWLNG